MERRTESRRGLRIVRNAPRWARRTDSERRGQRRPTDAPQAERPEERRAEGDRLPDETRVERSPGDSAPSAEARRGEILTAQLLALHEAASPTEQAYAILDHQIPYEVVVSVLEHLSPAVMVALVEVMTPRELIRHLSSLRRRGALEHPLVLPLIERKIGSPLLADRNPAAEPRDK